MFLAVITASFRAAHELAAGLLILDDLLDKCILMAYGGTQQDSCCLSHALAGLSLL